MSQKPLHLLQLVADVEDRAALGRQALEHDEQLVGLLRRQHRGRLVEDEQLRILQQRAHDLDALALADRQVARPRAWDRAAGRKRAILAQAAPTCPLKVPRRRAPSATFSATVRLSNSEKCWNTMPMPRAARLPRSGEDDRLALPADFALARLQQAVEDLDERRLARAVFAEQRVDLAAAQMSMSIVSLARNVAIALGQANRLEQRPGTGVHRRRRI